jgi:hypothetical protein
MRLKPITAVIVLLLVVASLLVTGCINNTSPNSNTGGGNTGVAFTVNSQTTLNKLGSGVLSSTPKPGYKYDVFDVTVTNLNRNDLAMGNPLYFKLTTNDGTVYSYSPSETWLDNDIQPVSGTNPGEKVTGQVAFEIPQSATATTLTYNDGVLGNIVPVKLTSSNQSSSTPAQISSIPSTSVTPTPAPTAKATVMPTSTYTPTPLSNTTTKSVTIYAERGCPYCEAAIAQYTNEGYVVTVLYPSDPGFVPQASYPGIVVTG